MESVAVRTKVKTDEVENLSETFRQRELQQTLFAKFKDLNNVSNELCFRTTGLSRYDITANT